MGNVVMILFAQITVKLLGMVYRMVITNIDGFGDAGNGFYNAGFQVFTVLLAISSVGIPNAIAKMVSERAALGDYKAAHRIFKTALKLFTVVGFVCSAILYIGSDFIAVHVLNMNGAQYVMRAISPSIFFVCVTSVVSGYFQGLNDMRATSFAQMIEQVFKCGLTILLVILSVGIMPGLMQFMTKVTMQYPGNLAEKTPPEIMAAWANAASSLSTIVAVIFLFIFYTKRKRALAEDIKNSIDSDFKPSTKRLVKMILMLSIPISLASIITSINRVVDLATITRSLEAAFSSEIPANIIGIVKGGPVSTSPIINPTAEQLNRAAVTLSGMLSKSDTLYNMPLALNLSFATVLVPHIAGALAKGDTKEASSKTSYSFLISILIILPCAIGFITLALPLYRIIYPNASAGYDLLSIMAVALIFSALTQTLTGALQGIGKVFVPACSILAGCVCKIILNLTLIRIPSINIYGAAISSIVCQFVAFLVNFTVLTRHIPLKLTLSKYVIKPLAAGAVMGGVIVVVYKAMRMVLGMGYMNNLICTVVSIAAAGIIYIALVLALRIMDEDDIKLLPGGTRIYSLLVRLKIYK
ncbi:MAG: polysaccharide biosynthesis protein [Oscillospiraceae bacterium]|nr:polysaccharide biosynthesis protein [Oscillospiraceae bacterium]